MTKKDICSGMPGWRCRLEGLSANEAVRLGEDDLGPSRAPMRRLRAKRGRPTGERMPRRRVVKGVTTGAAAVIFVALLVTLAVGSSPIKAVASNPSCSGASVTLVAEPQKVVEEVGLDTSASTAGSVLRAPYVAAAEAVVARSVSEGALLRVVPFGSSGVGAQPIFLGSFAAKSDDELFNIAASNRLRCVAERQITSLTKPIGANGELGSDIAGFIRSAILHARSVSAPKARITVWTATDGCEAPGQVGLNRRLTDVCGLLAAGRSAKKIIEAHAEEFTLPNASGVTIVMRGVGVGRRPSVASTALAERLIGFWGLVCRSAHATACVIGSNLP